MVRISRHSHRPEWVWVGSHWISSLLLADDVVLLALSSQDLQHVLGRFAAECQAAGMSISTSKSEAMVRNRKRCLAPSGLGESSFLKWRSLSILGSCSRVREGWSVRLTREQCSGCSHAVVVVEKELS